MPERIVTLGLVFAGLGLWSVYFIVLCAEYFSIGAS